MINIKNTFSRFKRNGRNKIIDIKNKAQKGTQNFRENFYEARKKPRSKRKSFVLGFSTALGVFGVVLLAPVLPALAKDLPNKAPKPDQICPSPSPASQPALVPSQKVVEGIAGAAAGMCALAVSSGSFLVGLVCAIVVGVGILKAQGK